jgi:hypothetical protein
LHTIIERVQNFVRHPVGFDKDFLKTTQRKHCFCKTAFPNRILRNSLTIFPAIKITTTNLRCQASALRHNFSKEAPIYLIKNAPKFIDVANQTDKYQPLINISR